MTTQRHTTSTLMLLALLLLGLTLTAQPAHAQQTFTVTATHDASDALAGDGVCETDGGACTLRAAIEEANATAGLDTITFNISGTGPHTIQPSSTLLDVTDPVVIDGLSQPGASCASWPPTLLVELDGSSAGFAHGLRLRSGASGSTIRGLVINNFRRHGIWVRASDDHTIACNFIGTDVSGTTDLSNGGDGIHLSGSANTTIGGLTVAHRNLISGNRDDGIVLDSLTTGAVIQGNYIGTDVTGTVAIPNRDGIESIDGAFNNTVGGTAPGARNIISGNSDDGVEFEAGSGSVVLGNYIGVDVTGTADLGNEDTGVTIDDGASNCTIGGTAPGAGNVISGNGTQGIRIDKRSNPLLVRANTVQGNYIGTNATGTAAIPNDGDGIFIQASNSNLIGGTEPGARNVISGNGDGDRGLHIVDSDSTIVQGNYFGTNASGTASLGNFGAGIRLKDDTDHTRIGGTEPGAGNLISGNSGGGIISTGFPGNAPDYTIVQGNYIGTNAAGTAAIPNSGDAMEVDEHIRHWLIGGDTPAARNLISGNLNQALVIDDNAREIFVYGNYIGTDITGTRALPNIDRSDIIEIDDGARKVYIGGPEPGQGNLISGNIAPRAIQIEFDADSIYVQGNFIGTDVTGSLPLPNTGHGIYVAGTSNDVTIGGIAPGAGNTIAFNEGIGVIVRRDRSGDDALRTRILGNAMFSNRDLGIDLTAVSGCCGDPGDGVTPNDVGDADTGPNNLQNHPLVADARVTIFGEFEVTYTVDSDPVNAAYPLRVEFFQADADNQEGQRFLGFDTYTAADFTAGSKTISLGQATATSVLATATDDSGNTSEFGAAQGVTIDPAADLEVQAKIERTQGAEATLAFAVKNHGHAASKATVKIDLPSDLLFVSASGDGSYNAQSGTWKTGKVKVGKVASLEVTVRRLSADAQTITATITKASVPDGVSENNSATLVLEAVQARLGEKPEALAASEALPTEFALSSNYPNPFNPATTIPFALPEASPVSIAVYDVTGRQVALLAEGEMAAGRHEVQFRAEGLPSGLYLVRMQAGAFSQVRRMTLIK